MHMVSTGLVHRGVIHSVDASGRIDAPPDSVEFYGSLSKRPYAAFHCEMQTDYKDCRAQSSVLLIARLRAAEILTIRDDELALKGRSSLREPFRE